MRIHIEAINHNTYKVYVNATNNTEHLVTVSTELVQRLTQGHANAIYLIEKSFEFLLQRESNTSILRKFDLLVINRYFPEYEEEMRKTFSA